MCGCYDVADCVCFLTFFITALVALLSVQYLVVFLDSFSINAQGKLSHLGAFLYFLVMTLLGCMVFAGIQRRSVSLLKWPGRLLIFLLISGILGITAYLNAVDAQHPAGVYDIKGKSLKLFVMLCVVTIYYVAIHRLICSIQNPRLNGAQSNHNLDDDSDQLSHPALIADFIKRRGNGGKGSKFLRNPDENEINRPFNVASDGINYYIVMLDSPHKSGECHYAISTKSKLLPKQYKYRHVANKDRDNDEADVEDNDVTSYNSITEV